jgi:hypothetical protein
MFRIQCTPINDILTSGIAIYPKSLRYLLNPFWTECALGVDVCNFAFCPTVIFWQLADYRGSHAQLTLASSELAEYFGDAHCLDAPTKHAVEIFAPSGDAAYFTSDMAKFRGGNEVVGCGLEEGGLLSG